ncbi:MAG: hypothetical protein U9N37_04280 [Thermodesulfobacteriota bacterium]|nr:hypothetical protein [Thermodesulfobacteriota bacterium]
MKKGSMVDNGQELRNEKNIDALSTAEVFSVVQIEGEGAVLSSNFSKTELHIHSRLHQHDYMEVNGHE